MLTKPVAIVLLLAAIVIAAFVGGYVAQQVRVPVSAENSAPTEGATPVVPAGEGAGGAAAGGGGAAAAGGGGGAAGRRSPRPGVPGQIPSAGGATGGAALPSATGVPNTVPGAGGATGLGAAPAPKEVSVPAGTIIGIELSSPLSSDTAKVEDPVEATIAKDVPIGSQIAIPAGTRVLGSVMLVDKGGRLKEPSQLGVRLHTLVPAVGPEVALSIEPLIHKVEATPEKSTKTIGIGAGVGAALGWILGGKEGAIKGGAAGAGGGTAAAMMAKPKPAELPKGAQALVKLMAPIVVTVR